MSTIDQIQIPYLGQYDIIQLKREAVPSAVDSGDTVTRWSFLIHRDLLGPPTVTQW